MKIILISGKAESGKDTAAEMLKKTISALGLRGIRLAFGDYVKITATDIWGWTGAKDDEGRALLQWWGTDTVREQEPLFWVDTITRLVKVIPKDKIDYILIPDCRFPNEIECWDGIDVDIITVRVERPGHISKLTPEQLMHISEIALDNWKFDIVLSATDMTGLYREVHKQMLPLLLK